MTQVTYRGRQWRTDPDGGAEIFHGFNVLREVHEHLWYLREAVRLCDDDVIGADLAHVTGTVEEVIALDAAALPGIDRGALRAAVSDVLRRASEHIRGGTPAGRDFTGKVLIAHDFRRADLRGASFVGACLIGSDFTGALLDGADLAGADLRGADLTGVDLSGCLFLTPGQVASAATPLPVPAPAPAPRPRRR